MRIISVSIQKGGTGKTTTADALLSIAAAAGLKTLAIDLDSQGNLTSTYRADTSKAGSCSVLTGAISAAEAIQHTARGDIIPAEYNLSAADIFISQQPIEKRDFLLKAAIEPIKNSYDIIVIDTAPALNTLLVNALTAATEVLIPVQADIFSLQSFYQLLATIGNVQTYCNRALAITGVFATRYNNRSIISRDMKEAFRLKCEEAGVKMLDTSIREGIAVKEAVVAGQALIQYAPRSNPAADYKALAKEIGITK